MRVLWGSVLRSLYIWDHVGGAVLSSPWALCPRWAPLVARSLPDSGRGWRRPLQVDGYPQEGPPPGGRRGAGWGAVRCPGSWCPRCLTLSSLFQPQTRRLPQKTRALRGAPGGWPPLRHRAAPAQGPGTARRVRARPPRPPRPPRRRSREGDRPARSQAPRPSAM